MIRTVLFDWDGTLCDSAAASLRAFTKTLLDFGLRLTHDQYVSLYTPDWYRMYEALGLPSRHWADADARWMYHFREEDPALLDGAATTIATLRDRGYRLGIVSSGTRSRIQQELARFGLDTVFGVLVANEDVANRKPHPEGLERAMDLLACDAAACCYVGDAPDDIRMGKNAGTMTVAVPSEYVSPRRLAECSPDVVLAHIGELPEALPLAALGDGG